MKTISIYHKLRMWGVKGAWEYLMRKREERATVKGFLRNAQKYPMQPQRGVTVIANLSITTSLSKMMRDFVLMLKKAGIPVQTYDLGYSHCAIDPQDLEGVLTPREEFRILKYDHVVEVFGGPFPTGLPLKRARIVFWEFETGLLEYFPDIAQGVDSIIGMSDFDVEVFHRLLPQGVPVHKVLYPFLQDVGAVPSCEQIRHTYGLSMDEFVVFFNFDFGSSFNRKNPDGALRAFAEAFRDTPRARLVFKTKGARHHPEEVAVLQRLAVELGVADRLKFIHEFIPMRDIYGLTQACDVYISLHRGEGFGLGIAEAMFLGKPVVVTNYSATTEFCPSHAAMLVPYEMRAVPDAMRDHVCYRSVRQWAEANVSFAAQALRRLYESPNLRQKLGAEGRRFIQEHFSVERFRWDMEELLSN